MPPIGPERVFISVGPPLYSILRVTSDSPIPDFSFPPDAFVTSWMQPEGFCASLYMMKSVLVVTLVDAPFCMVTNQIFP